MGASAEEAFLHAQSFTEFVRTVDLHSSYDDFMAQELNHLKNKPELQQVAILDEEGQLKHPRRIPRGPQGEEQARDLKSAKDAMELPQSSDFVKGKSRAFYPFALPPITKRFGKGALVTKQQ